MFQLVLEKAEEPQIKLPTSAGKRKSGKGNPVPVSCLGNLTDGGARQATVNGMAESDAT